MPRPRDPQREEREREERLRREWEREERKREKKLRKERERAERAAQSRQPVSQPQPQPQVQQQQQPQVHQQQQPQPQAQPAPYPQQHSYQPQPFAGQSQQPYAQQPYPGQFVPAQPHPSQPQPYPHQAYPAQSGPPPQQPPVDPEASARTLKKGCGCGCMGLAMLWGALFLVVGVQMIVSVALGLETADQRMKLPATATVETAYYTDEDGDWIHSSSTLKEGMKAFYKKTGVQPYVYILPNGTTTSIEELQQRAEKLYDELFQDEGHFLLVFCDDGNGGFNCGYAMGSEASAIMDAEALDVLADNLDKFYNTYSYSEEKMFSKAFENTAETIMPAGEPVSIGTGIVGVVMGLGLVIPCVYLLVRYRKRTREERERREREAILSMPLEKFGDQSIEELAEKYEVPDNRDQPREDAGTTIQP